MANDMPTLPQARIANALDYILHIIDPTWDGDIEGYRLPQKRIASQLEALQARIAEEGGIYAKVPMRVCGPDEYDSTTGEPTIENPEPNTFYLTPSGAIGDDVFIEWTYTNGKWEKFGSGGGAEVVTYLGNLKDVALNNPAQYHALVYDAESHKWENKELNTVAFAGISTDEFVIDAGKAADLD